jgi:putative DNA primase/helicase
MSGKPQPETLVTSELVNQCLDSNQLGDGTLYAAMHQGRFVFNKSSHEWMVWLGHSWDRDIMDEAKGAVEDVAVRYGEELAGLDVQISEAAKNGQKDLAKNIEGRKKEFVRRIQRLRGVNGRNAVLEFAAALPNGSSLAIKGDELDQDPWLLGFTNGVLNLRTGQFRAGRPGDYISKRCGCEWKGLDEECPTWDKFLWDSLENQHTIDFLHRWMGYCLTGVVTEQVFLILSGEGRNGKGVFVETVLSIMGDYSGPVQAEMLLDQGRAKSPDGPSPAIMTLFGRRLATASESDEARRFSPSKIKWFTGSDTLVGRYPHDKYERSFLPSHKLMLMTNNDPYAPADDFAFWQRVLKVDWPFKFVRNPKHPSEKERIDNLADKLKSEEPGIMARFVRGCMEWQAGGLQPTTEIRQAGESYRREQDLIQDYIEARCFVPSDPSAVATTATDIYQDFKTWYTEYHRAKVPTIQWFGRRMAKKFRKYKDGVVYYEGVGLLAT